jgi:hypothetical protein
MNNSVRVLATTAAAAACLGAGVLAMSAGTAQSQSEAGVWSYTKCVAKAVWGGQEPVDAAFKCAAKELPPRPL